jgi:hypothetical protein
MVPSVITLSVIMISFHYTDSQFAECRFDECHYPECRGAFEHASISSDDATPNVICRCYKTLSSSMTARKNKLERLRFTIFS